MKKLILAGSALSAATVADIAMTPSMYGQKDDDGAGGGDAPGDLATVVLGIKESIDARHDSFKEDLAKLAKDSGDDTVAFKKFKDDTDVKLTAYNDDMKILGEKLDELSQKVSRKGAPNGNEASNLSFGQQVINSEGIKSYDGGRVKMTVKEAGIKAITTAANSAGALVDHNSQRISGIITPPDRRLTVRGLLTVAQTNAASIQFVREASYTNAAATVAEGAAKPESDITFEADSEDVQFIAHWIAISRQAMDDAPGLAGQLDQRLRYGLDYKEELQLLQGDGTGTNLKGLVTMASDFARPAGLNQMVGATEIDVMRVAALQSTVNEYMASGYVLNPIDWCNIELTKDEEGRYIIAQPQGDLGARMWGLPVVPTNAMGVGGFLTGAMSQAVQLFDRMETEVLISDEDRDNFIKNMLTARAEKRLALVGYRPDALTYGNFTTAKAALAAA